MYAICKKHINKISVAYCPDCEIEALQEKVKELEKSLKQALNTKEQR